MSKNKHLASFFILILMLIGTTLPTKRAHAVLGIGDITIDIVQEAIKLTANTAAHTAQRLIIQQLVQSTVTWANSGFEGNPQYHINLQQDALNAANNSATAFITSLGQNPNLLCSPFRANITISLKDYYTPTSSFQCTFTGIAANLTNFYNNFTNGGGWNTWFQVTQVPGDNPYQVYVAGTQKIDTSVSASVSLLNQKAQINSGFLDVTPCIANNPNQAVMNKINKWRSGFDVTDITSPDYDPNVALGLYWDFNENNPDDYASLKSDQAAGKILYNPALAAGACIAHGDVETPGTVIKDQINGTVAAPLNQLINAQDWDEVVGALVAGLTKRIFTSATGLFNGQSGNSPTTGLPTGNETGSITYNGPDSTGTTTPTGTGGGNGGSGGGSGTSDLSCSATIYNSPSNSVPTGKVQVLWQINTAPSGSVYEYDWSGDDVASSTVYDSNTGNDTGTASYDSTLDYATGTALIVTYDTADADVNSGFKNMYLTASSTSTTSGQTVHTLDGPVACQPFNLATLHNPAT